MKGVEESHTVQSYLLMPGHMNGAGTLFGGQLLSWIDMLAGIVALRHAEGNVMTVAIDHLNFRHGAHPGDIVTLDGRVTWTGRTSMEVKIDTWRERYGTEKQLINTAYLVMVAVDENEKPIPVPGLKLDSEEVLREWAAGCRRDQLRKERYRENF